ncbi:hypothetical protein PW5551_10225 [Petrotoga sp. 9PW.55.5.1]|uniref:potassium channel family protein n=1 Tax=Petrotoga sp. 9PW.55.5.1 TaxID=1308979 RepID=UPI000DC33917|nr:potassium channel family protein [Petrotoga sp. 9PW.55.5.1]RAO98374.1 hypothetical protein PW5551_10225 [Petrotoga sp. 9PW.55.5.1]
MTNKCICIDIFDNLSLEEINNNNNNKDYCFLITKSDIKKNCNKKKEEFKGIIQKNIEKAIELINKNKIKQIIFNNIEINKKIVFEDLEFLEFQNCSIKSVDIKHADKVIFNLKEVSDLKIFFEEDKQYIIKNVNFESIKFQNLDILNVNNSKKEFMKVYSNLIDIKLEGFEMINNISFHKCLIDDFFISENTIKEIFFDDTYILELKMIETNISELKMTKTEVGKLLIKLSSIKKSFILEASYLNKIDISSSTYFEGNNFRINNCKINYAKFESVYFSSNTMQLYYNRNIEENIDNIIFKNCIFNSYKTTFSNGKYNLISFYESIFDTYFYFNPELVQNIDFDKSYNNKVFKFNYNFDDLDIIDFTNFLNMGKFVIAKKYDILKRMSLDILFNKIINYGNQTKLLDIYDCFYKNFYNKNKETGSNINKFSNDKKDEYLIINISLTNEIFNENKMYDIEDYFNSKYKKIKYKKSYIGKIDLFIDNIFNKSFEIFKKNIFIKKLFRSLENFIFNISNYGESYSKIIGRMIGFVLFFSIIVFISANIIPNSLEYSYDTKELTNINNHISFGDSLYFTIITFFTLGYGDFIPVGNWMRVLAGIISFVGVFLSAYLIAIFARKMMRK